MSKSKRKKERLKVERESLQQRGSNVQDNSIKQVGHTTLKVKNRDFYVTLILSDNTWHCHGSADRYIIQTSGTTERKAKQEWIREASNLPLADNDELERLEWKSKGFEPIEDRHDGKPKEQKGKG